MSLGGRALKLPRKEFLIISRLARNPERIVASEELWQHAWGGRAPFNAESLHVHIYRLRRRLEPAGLHVDTMVNVGYRLLAAAHRRGRRRALTLRCHRFTSRRRLPDAGRGAVCSHRFRLTSDGFNTAGIFPVLSLY